MRADVTEKKETPPEWFLYKAALKASCPQIICSNLCPHIISCPEQQRLVADDVTYLLFHQPSWDRAGTTVFCWQGCSFESKGPQSYTEPTYLPSTSSRDVRVRVVEERKVVGSVLVSTGFLSLMLVALGAGGSRPGTGEKKKTGVGHRSPTSLHMVPE